MRERIPSESGEDLRTNEGGAGERGGLEEGAGGQEGECRCGPLNSTCSLLESRNLLPSRARNRKCNSEKGVPISPKFDYSTWQHVPERVALRGSA